MAAKISFRQATVDDIEAMIDVEAHAWDNGTPRASAEQFEARLRAWPEGQWVGIFEGRIVGVVNTMLVKDFDLANPNQTWDQITNNGFVEGVHTDEGNMLFGVNMSARTDAPRGIGTLFLFNLGKLIIERGLRYGILGGRMPDYSKYQDRYTPEEYLEAKNEAGEYLDPEIRFYHQPVFMHIAGLMPNYMHDPDSCDYGVLLVWKNPFYHMPKFMRKPLKTMMNLIM